MHVLGVFEVIYMHICVFSILKCRELKKNKKQKLLLELCGMYAHGTLPCAYTRQKFHVSHTCASWERAGVLARGISVRASRRRTAKGTGGRTAIPHARHRLDARRRFVARQRPAARQRKTAHGKGCHHGNETRRTAKFARHGKVLAVRIWQDARQRVRCRARHCRASRQCLCHAYSGLCVQLARTAMPAFPVVTWSHLINYNWKRHRKFCHHHAGQHHINLFSAWRMHHHLSLKHGIKMFAI
jgi:hypothetical protein